MNKYKKLKIEKNESGWFTAECPVCGEWFSSGLKTPFEDSMKEHIKKCGELVG